MKLLSLTLLLAVHICLSSGSEIVRARLESCPGCSLNQLTEVRKFVYEDIPTYENVEWKKISGAPPELVFLNSQDEQVERIPLRKLNRQECNDLLLARGFTQKSTKEL